MTRIYEREWQGPLGTEGEVLCFNTNAKNEWHINEGSWGPVGGDWEEPSGKSRLRIHKMQKRGWNHGQDKN